jgi:hypothetical protein
MADDQKENTRKNKATPGKKRELPKKKYLDGAE